MNKYDPELGKQKVKMAILSDAINAARENSVNSTMKEAWSRKPYYMIAAAEQKRNDIVRN